MLLLRLKSISSREDYQLSIIVSSNLTYTLQFNLKTRVFAQVLSIHMHVGIRPCRSPVRAASIYQTRNTEGGFSREGGVSKRTARSGRRNQSKTPFKEKKKTYFVGLIRVAVMTKV